MTATRNGTATTTSATPSGSVPTAAGDDDGYTLRIDHLTKRYGTSTVVDDLSFSVEPGRGTGFLGSNGSGKSTTNGRSSRPSSGSSPLSDATSSWRVIVQP